MKLSASNHLLTNREEPMNEVRRIRSLVLMAAAFLLITAFSAAAAVAAPAVHVQKTSPAKVTAYWTQDKMRAALNAPPPAVQSDRPIRKASEARTRPSGPPAYVPPSSPGKPSSGVIRGEVPSTQAPQVAYRRLEITSPSTYPYSTHGKLFFTMYDTARRLWRPSSCSGTVVTSASKSVIVTAGHCVHSGRGGAWHRNIVFVPGYRAVGSVSQPFGQFTANRYTTSTSWTTSSSFEQDYAMVRLNANSRRQLVQNLTGSRGIAWNQSRSQSFQSYGYPADRPFNGSRLYRCDSNYAGYGSGTTMGIGCDMTGGASGGGWMIRSSIVNSVNSYKFNTQPGMMYGPYFNSTLASFYNSYR